MSANSKIEWTDHTFNPWWGCTKISPACKLCYANSLAKRTGNDVWGDDKPRRFFGEKHWAEPLKWNAAAEREGVRRRVFCASMADVFEDHPDDEIAAKQGNTRERLGQLILATPALDWLLLTKRPENAQRACFDLGFVNCQDETRLQIPPNVWVGVTAENQEYADKRIPLLLKIPAAVRFVSYEPALGPVDFSPWLIPPYPAPTFVPVSDSQTQFRQSYADAQAGYEWARDWKGKVGLDWIISGGESGSGARPAHPDWFRSVRDQCAAARVAYFHKQWGEYETRGRHTGKIPAWADHRTGLINVAGNTRGVAFDSLTNALAPFDSSPCEWVRRVGKKAAGRLLDGREHSEFPEVRP